MKNFKEELEKRLQQPLSSEEKQGKLVALEYALKQQDLVGRLQHEKNDLQRLFQDSNLTKYLNDATKVLSGITQGYYIFEISRTPPFGGSEGRITRHGVNNFSILEGTEVWSHVRLDTVDLLDELPTLQPDHVWMSLGIALQWNMPEAATRRVNISLDPGGSIGVSYVRGVSGLTEQNDGHLTIPQFVWRDKTYSLEEPLLLAITTAPPIEDLL